jgi:hypothetical protein
MHHRRFNAFVLIATMVLLTGCVGTRPARSDFAFASVEASDGLLDGSWKGRLTIRRPYVWDIVQDDLELQVHLQGETARVHVLLEDGGLIEAMPEEFKVTRQGPSAVLVAITSDDDWTEAWVLSLAVHSENALLAEWSRTVRNLTPTAQDLVFSSAAVGMLRREQDLSDER